MANKFLDMDDDLRGVERRLIRGVELTEVTDAWEPSEQELEVMARAMCAHVEAQNGLTVADYRDLGVGSAASFVDKFWPNYVSQAKAGLIALVAKRQET